MGRSVRKVHASWVHPLFTADDAQYPQWVGSPKPLHGPDEIVDWLRGKAMFPLVPDYRNPGKWQEQGAAWRVNSWEEYAGEMPSTDECMPQWPEDQRTHYQMYETVSEGTPISPVFATPEELARWLADNDGNAGAGHTASYEAWLRVCKGGYAPSFILSDGVLQSGVEALKDESA